MFAGALCCLGRDLRLLGSLVPPGICCRRRFADAVGGEIFVGGPDRGVQAGVLSSQPVGLGRLNVLVGGQPAAAGTSFSAACRRIATRADIRRRGRSSSCERASFSHPIDTSRARIG